MLGGSAFNVKSESLRLGDFSEQEIRALLAQHTAATGQTFTEQAQTLIGARTAGQPWLVNALCSDACFRHPPGRDRSRPITADAILEAQEGNVARRLIGSRSTLRLSVTSIRLRAAVVVQPRYVRISLLNRLQSPLVGMI